MSLSTLFAAGPDGDLLPVIDYSNAGRGAVMVWQCLIAGHLQKEQKELPPHEYWLGNERFMEKLWKLAYQPAVSRIERICLMATFDRVLVRGPERGLLVEAFRWFMTLVEPYCHLGAMANDLEALPDDTRAIGWRWTSVAENLWRVPLDEEDERPYNIDRDSGHFWLFEELP